MAKTGSFLGQINSKKFSTMYGQVFPRLAVKHSMLNIYLSSVIVQCCSFNQSQ